MNSSLGGIIITKRSAKPNFLSYYITSNDTVRDIAALAIPWVPIHCLDVSLYAYLFSEPSTPCDMLRSSIRFTHRTSVDDV